MGSFTPHKRGWNNKDHSRFSSVKGTHPNRSQFSVHSQKASNKKLSCICVHPRYKFVNLTIHLSFISSNYEDAIFFIRSGNTPELVVNFHPFSKSNPTTRSCRASFFIHGNPLHIYPSFILTTIIIRFGSASSKVAGEIETGNLESVFSSHRKAHTAA